MRLSLPMRPEAAAAAGLVLLLGVQPARALPANPQTPVGWHRSGAPIPAGALADGAGADLAGALFWPEADLDGAVLAWANLTDAVLRQVSLRGVRLEGANLTRADFTGARLDQDLGQFQALLQAGVTAVKWDPIEAEHHFGAGNGKGQFTRSRGSHPAVAELIHRCLADPVCDPILSWDGNGLAMRRFNHVIGYYWDARPPRRWRPTGNLVVVVSPDQETLLTAYPVREF